MSNLPYASPDAVVANKCRVDNKKINLFVIKFDIKTAVDNNGGMAVVAADGANSAIKLLKTNGIWMESPEVYSVYYIQEIEGATYEGNPLLISEISG